MEIFGEIYRLLKGSSREYFVSDVVTQIEQGEIIFYKGGEMRRDSAVMTYLDRYNYAKEHSTLENFEGFDNLVSKLQKWQQSEIYYCTISDLSRGETILIFTSKTRDELIAIMKNKKISYDFLDKMIKDGSDNYIRFRMMEQL